MRLAGVATLGWPVFEGYGRRFSRKVCPIENSGGGGGNCRSGGGGFSKYGCVYLPMLVGKVITDRTVNLDALRRTMNQIWALNHGLVVRTIDTNTFVFQFFHWKDKEKILEGRPWSFEQKLLVLQPIEGDEQPSQVVLDSSPFWVRLYNLPFNCRAAEDVRVVASCLGPVLDVDVDDFGIERFCRVKVMLNIFKPLRRQQRIRRKDGMLTLIEYKYECLSYFCFRCGVLGHSDKDCSVEISAENESELGWGAWLKASPHKGRSRNREEAMAIKARKKVLFVVKEDARKSEEPKSLSCQVETSVLNAGGAPVDLEDRPFYTKGLGEESIVHGEVREWGPHIQSTPTSVLGQGDIPVVESAPIVKVFNDGSCGELSNNGMGTMLSPMLAADVMGDRVEVTLPKEAQVSKQLSDFCPTFHIGLDAQVSKKVKPKKKVHVLNKKVDVSRHSVSPMDTSYFSFVDPIVVNNTECDNNGNRKYTDDMLTVDNSMMVGGYKKLKSECQGQAVIQVTEVGVVQPREEQRNF